MNVHECACMCMYVHVCACICVYVRVCACMCVYARVCARLCVQKRAGARMYSSVSSSRFSLRLFLLRRGAGAAWGCVGVCVLMSACVRWCVCVGECALVCVHDVRGSCSSTAGPASPASAFLYALRCVR